MAEQIRLIRLTWENNVSFKCDSKLDDGEWVLVIEIDENNHLKSVWDNEITGIITSYLGNRLSEIGNEMKA